MISSRLFFLTALIGYCFAGGLQAAEAPSTHLTLSSAAIKPNARQFTADSLYGLLTAEIAESRQLNDVALRHYIQQALQTRDPQVVARATMIARYVNDRSAALQMSELWVEIAPSDKEALANASLILIQAGRLQDALEMSKRLKTQGGATLFQNIAARANILTKSQREQLLQRYKNILPNHGHDEQLLVGIGTLLQQQNRFADALSYAHQALRFYPRSISAAMLEVNLLHALKRNHEAIAKMSELLALYPANTNLRTQYARSLSHHDMASAQQQFTILSEQLPNDADVHRSLGIIAMDRKDFKTASKAFERLLDTNQHLSQAHYYLGQIAENQQQWEHAIFNYLLVGKGNDFLPATTNLLDIFIRKGDLLSTQQHMSRARLRYPDQAKSLYLLHAQALINHNFLREAEAVLNEALALNPNDPTIINSIVSTTMKRLTAVNATTINMSTP